jgi:zinc transporter 1/2/3
LRAGRPRRPTDPYADPKPGALTILQYMFLACSSSSYSALVVSPLLVSFCIDTTSPALLTESVIACAFPIAAKRFPRFPVPHLFLFISRHFGTGVLIATAFVHLFPTAYISLTDPCLAPFWNKGYPAMPGLIAMTSVFAVVGIEMFFAMRGAGHKHTSDFDSMAMENGNVHEHASLRPARSSSNASFKRRPPDIILPPVAKTNDLIAGYSPSVGNPSPLPPSGRFGSTDSRRSSQDSSDSINELELDELEAQQSSGLLNGGARRATSIDSLESPPIHPDRLKPDRKALLQCLLLEAGILFHSVFIGMALSVTPAPAFYILLVAISFHQTFEGLALGSRISALTFSPRSPQPWLMALAYGTTTPLGQAIGLAIHSMYDPGSETGLLSVGIMNAISSGLLLFAGLVELLAADFLSEESYETLRGKRRYQACGSVVAGAALMALVGAWA